MQRMEYFSPYTHVSDFGVTGRYGDYTGHELGIQGVRVRWTAKYLDASIAGLDKVSEILGTGSGEAVEVHLGNP